MTLPAPTYDLVLLLDTQADAPVRAKIVADARATIEAKGELLRYDEWGERALAYPIDHKVSAEYHLLQFHASAAELMGELERTLRITDGVIRSRIVKLKPGTPEAPDLRPGRRPEGELGETSPAPAAVQATSPPPAEHEVEPEPAVGEPA